MADTPRKTAIFREQDIAFLGGNPGIAFMEETFTPYENFEFMSAPQLIGELSKERHNLLINPYGEFFPKNAWAAIMSFLEEGGNLLNIGGMPFQSPVLGNGEEWRVEERQTCYLKELNLNYSGTIKKETIHSFESCDPHLSVIAKRLRPCDVFSLIARLTDRNDNNEEAGSSGHTDAELRPVVFGLDSARRKVATPVFLIDRLQGRFAGGRWVFATFPLWDGFYGSDTGVELVRHLVELAGRGAMDFKIRPSLATYHKGEAAQLTLHAKSFGNKKQTLSLDIHIIKDKMEIGQFDTEVLIDKQPTYRQINLDLKLTPGLHEIRATLKESGGFTMEYCGGFWSFDQKLLESGEKIKRDKDYFTKGDRPYPVIGTTYMSSESHRKFLFDPNPYIWDKDFQSMRETGVNMVRTGIWTGIRHIMLDSGVPNESVLRALEAYLLTAFKYDIPVVFTFFTFFPESWGGENPYLAPRSVQAQKEYVSAIVQRFRNAKLIIWDLINEPSFCNPKRIFKLCPNYDEFELRAWREWLRNKHGSIDSLQAEWRCTPSELRDFDCIDLPSEFDFACHRFNDQYIFNGIKPFKAAEYRLFAQYAFNHWIREISDTIRNSGSDGLITVGLQAEKGLVEDPSPQFHASEVDFTCAHSWLLNDDLLTDSLMAKTGGKPMLIEETGMMYQENIDGFVRYTEEDAKNLLERKIAYALCGNAAGVVQWQWETNVYKKIHHETGLIRADHSEKPIGETMRLAAAFTDFSRDCFKGRIYENVCIVIPYSNMFTAKESAIKSLQKSIKAIHHYCLFQAYCVGEYNLAEIEATPSLIVLPSARVFSQKNWVVLMSLVRSGSTLLITGSIDSNNYYQHQNRLGEFGLKTTSCPVAREELINIGGEEVQLSYERDWHIYMDKSVIDNNEKRNVVEIPLGKGKIFYCTHPVELAANIEPTVKLYQHALRRTMACATPIFTMDKVDPSILIRPMVFKESVLYTIVSENNQKRELQLIHQETKTAIKVVISPQRAEMFFLNRSNGELISAYIHDSLQVGKTTIHPGGDLAISLPDKPVINHQELSFMAGKRDNHKIQVIIDKQNLNFEIDDKCHFQKRVLMDYHTQKDQWIS